MKVPDQFIKILKQMDESRSYGSVEVFFEDGKITQVTQRVITKINPKRHKIASKSKLSRVHPKTTGSNVPVEETIVDIVV